MGKKICFIATHAYALFNPTLRDTHGGSEVQLYTIAKELAKDRENQVSFIVGDFGQPKYECYNGIRVVRTFNPQTKESIFLKGRQALRYFFTLIRESPDVCITSSANSTVGIVGIYCVLFKRKHIHRVANIIDVDGRWMEGSGFLGKVYRYGLEHADEVVCQTEEQKRALLKNHKVDATLFRNVFDFEQKSSAKKRGYILWVGRASPIKRAERFLELASKNPNLNFVMIFNRQDEDYYNKIKDEADRLKNLKFIERIPFSKIQKYYDEAKVLVSTSDYEGFANTFIQAGIGRTPIISLNSNPDDFINEYKCGYFAKGSMERLNEGLKKLFDDRVAYEELSKNIYEYVRAKYDVKKNIPLLKKLV